MSWPRRDVATASVGLTGDARDVQLRGPDGQPVPLQILNSQRDNDGALLRVEFAFLARDLPALGYAVYRVLPLKTPAAATPAASLTPPDGVLENEFCQVQCDPATGAITSLILKDDRWNALGGPGNVVAEEPDHGDCGKSIIPWTGEDATRRATGARPAAGQGGLQHRAGRHAGHVLRGPVFSELAVPPRPFGQKGSLATSVGCTPASAASKSAPRSSTKTNRSATGSSSRPRSPRAAASTRSPSGPSSVPTASTCPPKTGSITATAGTAWPCSTSGIRATTSPTGRMMLSLMRCEPLANGPSTDGTNTGLDTGVRMVQQRLRTGQERTFTYGLVPHAGDWRQAGVYRDGLELIIRSGRHRRLVRRGAARSMGFSRNRSTQPGGLHDEGRPRRDRRASLYEAEGRPVSGAMPKLPPQSSRPRK